MNKLYDEDDIKAIADAIRIKTGKNDTLVVSDMASEIQSIEVGGSGEVVDRLFRVYKITIPSDMTSIVTLLDNNDFINLHYTKVGFTVSLTPLSVQESGSVSIAYVRNGNRPLAKHGEDIYYGIRMYANVSTVSVQVASRPVYNNNMVVYYGYPYIRDGKVEIYCNTSNSLLKAGEYLLTLSVVEETTD